MENLRELATICYQDYSPKVRIEGVQIDNLKRAVDDSGSFVELGRVVDFNHVGFNLCQVNLTTLEPAAIKGLHLHFSQIDKWYAAPTENILLVLHDLRPESLTVGQTNRIILGRGHSIQVTIPPGVAHGAKNLSMTTTATVVYLVDKYFNPDPRETEEGRLPWDFLGSDIWEMTKE